MAVTVDYSKLSRKELQALCKQHKIPANKSNAFMAEALDATLNNGPRPQEEFDEDALAPESPVAEQVVEKVKGKRRTKKAVLPEKDVDALAEMLAGNKLDSDEQVKDTDMAALKSEEPDNILPLAPVPTAPKARKGRRTAKSKVVSELYDVEHTKESIPDKVMALPDPEQEPHSAEPSLVQTREEIAPDALPDEETEELVPVVVYQRSKVMKGASKSRRKEKEELLEAERVKGEELEITARSEINAEDTPSLDVEEGTDETEPAVQESIGKPSTDLHVDPESGVESTTEADDQVVPDVNPLQRQSISWFVSPPPALPREEPAVKAKGRKPRKAKVMKKGTEEALKESDEMMEAEKENLQEPRTPVKTPVKTVDPDSAKKELQNLSIRQLQKQCRERGLRTRANNRPLKL